MASKTSTETKREITRRGDVIIVKEVEKTITFVPGKEPAVKEVTRVEEYRGEEEYKRIPEDIRRQLERSGHQKTTASANEAATRIDFVTECLAEHNKYRKIHGVQPLTLSARLVEVSEKRAKELAQKDEVGSRSDRIYGENLSCTWSSDTDHFVRGSDVVARWYSEGKNYDYDEEPENLSSGHFTQVIWENSKEFGVAAAKSASNKIYVVASYSPPGNIMGEFKGNVRPVVSKPRCGMNDTTEASNSKKSERKSGGAAEKNDRLLGESEISRLNEECIACHNEYRKRHGVPLLVYSEHVAAYAQEWASALARADKFEHRRERKYGENLYCFKSTNPQAVATAADACRSWYGEMQDYDFDAEANSLATGHFTQMIWKATKEVGMGRAKSVSGLQIIVANYNPPGNHLGMYGQNVPKPVN